MILLFRALASSISGTSAVSQATATSTATGAITIAGTSAVTQTAATTTASGALAIGGSSAVTQSNATATATGALTITGTSAVTQSVATHAAADVTASGTADVLFYVARQGGTVTLGGTAEWTPTEEPWSDVQAIDTSAGSLDLHGATDLRYLYVRNLSPSAVITLSLEADGSNPFCRLYPDRFALIPPPAGATLYAKSTPSPGRLAVAGA